MLSSALSALSRPLYLAAGVVNAFVSFLQCAGLSRQVGGRNASQPVIKQPVATLLLFQAGSNAMGRSSCITSLPSIPALTSFVNVHLLGTAGAGSRKFTVCMNNVAQTQHVSNDLVCSLEFVELKSLETR